MICLHVLLVWKASVKKLLHFHQMLPFAPPPLAIRRSHLTQKTGVPLRAAPAFPCHRQQQEAPHQGVPGGMSREVAVEGAENGNRSWAPSLHLFSQGMPGLGISGVFLGHS